MNKNEYITLCKQKSYDLQKNYPSLKHSKLLDLAAQELGFKHYTAIVNLLPESLQVVFANLKPKIEQLKKDGHFFCECASCGFESQEYSGLKNIVYDSKCLVCKLKEKCLDIECDDCGEVVSFAGEGFATCESCKKVYEPDDVARVIIDDNAAYIAGKEGSDTTGSCSNCETYDTVVLTENDEWVCASCFGVFDDLEQCGYCGHLNTGSMEDSYSIGCVMCEGMMGKYKDD